MTVGQYERNMDLVLVNLIVPPWREVTEKDETDVLPMQSKQQFLIKVYY